MTTRPEAQTAETESMEGIRQRHALVEQSADKIATAAAMAYLSHLDRGDLLKKIDRLHAWRARMIAIPSPSSACGLLGCQNQHFHVHDVEQVTRNG